MQWREFAAAKGLLAAGWLLAMGLLAPSAWAGRPLVTDDATIVDPRSCQLEAWFQRAQDGAIERWALPACNVGGKLELTLGGARLSDNRRTANAGLIQAKTVLRPLEPGGWGLALSLADQFDPQSRPERRLAPQPAAELRAEGRALARPRQPRLAARAGRAAARDLGPGRRRRARCAQRADGRDLPPGQRPSDLPTGRPPLAGPEAPAGRREHRQPLRRRAQRAFLLDRSGLAHTGLSALGRTLSAGDPHG